MAAASLHAAFSGELSSQAALAGGCQGQTGTLTETARWPAKPAEHFTPSHK